MDQPKYFRMKLELFPPDIVKQYKLDSKADEKGYVFFEVTWDVRTTTGRKTSTGSTLQTNQQSRILLEQNNTRILETQIEAD